MRLNAQRNDKPQVTRPQWMNEMQICERSPNRFKKIGRWS
jgi:hypothetical protein